MDRKTKFLWMRDILEHMEHCFEQWQGADDRMEQYLAESIQRDLDEFRRLCQSMKRDGTRVQSRQVVAA